MNLERPVLPSLATRLFGGHPDRRLALLRAAWPQAVGLELARRTEVLALTAGTLRVRVPDAAWRKVLHGLQASLRARLRDVVGATLAPSRLAFQEASVELAPREPATPELAAARAPAPGATASEGAEPGGPPVPEAVRAGAAAILDPEIRERFLSTAARAWARRRPQPPKEP